MLQITREQLLEVIDCDDQVDLLLPELNSVIVEFKINTPQRLAHFLGQLCHESCNLSAVIENLNYSKKRLLEVFPRYFNSTNVDDYARQPQKIANKVYSNRYGNGPEASGDGWRYRGRGYIQLTFKDNYRYYGELIGEDLVNHPTKASKPEIAIKVAAAYWKNRRCNEMADNNDINGITRAINGGYNGLADRRNQVSRVKRILGC